MFNGLPATTTPAYQFWDFSKSQASFYNRIALTDDCAPFQFIYGGAYSSYVYITLPTNPPPGKSITFKASNYTSSYGSGDTIYYFYDSSNTNLAGLLYQCQNQVAVTFTYIPELTKLSAYYNPAPVSCWVMTNTAFLGDFSSTNSYAVSQGYNNRADLSYTTIGGGSSNIASNSYAVIGGGSINTSSGYYSVVGGGNTNNASGSYSFIGGGQSQVASGNNAFVGGGSNNSASGPYASIAAGQSNISAGPYNFIGSGYANSGTSATPITTVTTTIPTVGSTVYLNAPNASVLQGMLFAQSLSNTSASSITITSGSKTSSGIVTGTPAVMATSTISGTTLTVGSLTSGTIIAGMVLTGTGVTAGTYIVSGSGSSWVVSASQSVSSTTITGTAYTITIGAANTFGNAVYNIYGLASVTTGGGNNQATGTYAFIGSGGDAGTATERNTASGPWSVVAGGAKNTASGNFSYIGGGYTNTADGTYSAIPGGYQGTTRSVVGAFNYASGMFATQGDAQIGNYAYRLSTATGTIVYLTTDGTGTRSATNQAVISTNNYAYAFDITVVARDTTNNTDQAAWKILGLISNNAGTVSITGTPTVTLVSATSGATTNGWGVTGAITISADTTNKALSIGVTQVTTNTLHWLARVETTEVG